MRLIDADHLRRWILSRVFKTQLSVADIIDQIDREDTIEPDPDTVSRQDVITLVENIENRRLMGEIDLTYAPMLKGVKALSPSPIRPQGHSKQNDDFEKQIHSMFDHIWDCEIEHPVFQDTVGDLMNAVIKCHADIRGGAV